jgi:hypothetical protein
MYGLLFMVCILCTIILVVLDAYDLLPSRSIDRVCASSVRLHVILLYTDARIYAQVKAVRAYMSYEDITVLYKDDKPENLEDVQYVQYNTATPFLDLPDLVPTYTDTHLLWLGDNVIPVTNIYASTFLYCSKWVVCNHPIDAIVLGVPQTLPIPLVPLYLQTIRECKKNLETLWSILLARVDVIMDAGHIGVVTRFTGIQKLDESILTHTLQTYDKYRKKQRWRIVYSTDDSVFAQVFV